MNDEILKAIERLESKVDQLLNAGGKARGDKSQCNKCNVDIFWGKTFKGKSVPMNLGINPVGDWKVVNGIAGKFSEQHDTPETPRYTCHFDTCTNRQADGALPTKAQDANSNWNPSASETDIPF